MDIVLNDGFLVVLLAFLHINGYDHYTPEEEVEMLWIIGRNLTGCYGRDNNPQKSGK